MNGFYNVYKTPDMTSSDVVVKLRGLLRARTGIRYKVGHLGTLDPAAEGVLPIAVGNATKLFDYLLDKQKTYRATFVWGETTDTLDATGKVTTVGDRVTDVARVLASAKCVVVTYPQIPPQYSAKSVGGKRAYDLARKGVEVALSPKEVTVYGVELVQSQDNVFVFDITCSAGTYIRAVCRDMATSMGTVGYMQHLLRTRSGEFDLDSAVRLSEIDKDYLGAFMPLMDYAMRLPSYDFDESRRKDIQNGVPYAFEIPQKTARIDIAGEPYGIGCTVDGLLKIICRL